MLRSREDLRIGAADVVHIDAGNIGDVACQQLANPDSSDLVRLYRVN